MDLLIAAVVLAVSTLFYVLAGDFPRMAADPGGLALFPRAVAAATGLASAAILVQGLIRRQIFPAGAGALLAGLPDAVRTHRLALVTFLLVLLFPFAITAFGFVAAVAIFSTLVLVASGLPMIKVAVTAVLTTVGIYVAYALILGAILPTGYLFY